MTSKTYLRYEEVGTFGLVASADSNLVVDEVGLHVATSGVQDVLVWNLRSGELAHRFEATDSTRKDPDAIIRQVTAIAISPADKFIAAGYASGEIRLWEYQKRSFVVIWSGHRVAITSLRFSPDNTKLVSGSKDTDVIIWDVIAQTGLFRLKGHKQEITDCWFLGSSSNQLITSSKDSLMKLWDLETQNCTHTFVGHRSPVWSLAISPDQKRIYTGSSDNLLRGFAFMEETDRAEQEKRGEGENSNSLVQVVTTSQNGIETTAVRQLGAPWEMMQGSIPRQSTERSQTVAFSKDGRYFACQTAGKTIEVYLVRNKEEIQKKVKRRLKRIREKKKRNDSEQSDDSKVQLGDEIQLLAAMRTEHRMRSFAFGQNDGESIELIISFNSNCVEVYSLEVKDVEDEDAEDTSKKRKRDVQLKRSRAIELQGHRNDIRSIAISSDNTLVLTAASGAAKLWNINTKNCIRTFPSGYSLCCAFVPGDMHALVGTKSGHLLVFNLATGEMLQEIEAHDDAIWAIDIRPDGKGFVTGSADKQVKFWEFELNASSAPKIDPVSTMTEGNDSDDSDSDNGEEDDMKESKPSDSDSDGSVEESKEDKESDEEGDEDDESESESGSEEEPIAKRAALEDTFLAPEGILEVVHVRTLKMTDDVMCVKYSHHKGSTKLLLAVSLLDCTVKVFFEDSLKFALSLYGHKLPVLSMDISSDNTLIATASADKNVKIWGLDFGDCHKSFFAHDAAVMSVRFAPNTHYFFTAGKDNRVRYWDADRFEMILSLERHVSEVWSLAVSSDAAFIISSGHDKALRIWERTNDIVFPDEEREKEMEKRYDAKLLQDVDQSKVGTLAVDAVKELHGGEVNESGVATKRTNESIRAGERLMEAIEIANLEREKLKKYEEELAHAYSQLSEEEEEKARMSGKPPLAPPQPNILLLGRKPTDHVLLVLRGIKSNELDEAIMLLPFNLATSLFYYLEHVFVNDSAASSLNVELAAKVAIALLRIHFKQIVATHALKNDLQRLRKLMRASLSKLQDMIGTNMMAVRTLKSQVLESVGGFGTDLSQ